MALGSGKIPRDLWVMDVYYKYSPKNRHTYYDVIMQNNDTGEWFRTYTADVYRNYTKSGWKNIIDEFRKTGEAQWISGKWRLRSKGKNIIDADCRAHRQDSADRDQVEAVLYGVHGVVESDTDQGDGWREVFIPQDGVPRHTNGDPEWWDFFE